MLQLGHQTFIEDPRVLFRFNWCLLLAETFDLFDVFFQLSNLQLLLLKQNLFVFDCLVCLSQNFGRALKRNFFFGVLVLEVVTLFLDLCKPSLKRLNVNIVTLEIFNQIPDLCFFPFKIFFYFLNFTSRSFAIALQEFNCFFVLASLPLSISDDFFLGHLNFLELTNLKQRLFQLQLHVSFFGFVLSRWLHR